MGRPLKGIALILFGLLFYAVSGDAQAFLWRWHVGISVPWGAIALAFGVAGLMLAFSEKTNPTKGD